MPNTNKYAGPTISKKSEDRSWEAYDKWAKNNPKEAEIDLTSAQDDPSFREHAYGKEYVDAVKKQKKKEMTEAARKSYLNHPWWRSAENGKDQNAK
ncbi:MAG: hypothetical protein EBU96_08255 [Actinobacteria bacterium]|nr:hypothetical protein [Actinomycetota bacterium]